jgi:Tol biopolymer transport system component
MKKLLLSSIILLLFSCSILIFQVSCQKEANAGTNNITTMNKIVYMNYDDITGLYEIYTSNLDGTNNTKVPITIPSGLKMNDAVAITPDGNKLIFTLRNINSSTPNHIGGSVYTCKLDGSELTKIIGSTTSDNLQFSISTY